MVPTSCSQAPGILLVHFFEQVRFAEACVYFFIVLIMVIVFTFCFCVFALLFTSFMGVYLVFTVDLSGNGVSCNLRYFVFKYFGCCVLLL